MVKHHNYTEYGVNLISVNWVIHNIMEPEIVKFCCSHNFKLTEKSRDTKRIISHFLAESVLSVCKEHVSSKNILNYTPVDLCLMDKCFNKHVDQMVVNFFKKFKFCNVGLECGVDQLTLDQLYQLKALADTCHVRVKNLEQLKKYLSSNHFVKLYKDVRTDIVLRCVLAK